jgi:hypothetical protein
MPANTRRAVALSFVLGSLFVAGAALPHLRFPTVRAERFIELRLAEEPVRVAYRVGFGASLADEVRKAADVDGDFQVSVAEGNAALDARTQAFLSAIRICTGRTLEDLVCRRPSLSDVERVEAEGWEPGPTRHLHFSWTLRVRENAADIGALSVEDAYEVAGVEVSDVQIERPSHGPLVRAGDGALGSGVTERFNWVERLRAPGPRVVVAAWAPPRRRAGFIAASLVLAAVALGAWLLARRSRN